MNSRLVIMAKAQIKEWRRIKRAQPAIKRKPHLKRNKFGFNVAVHVHSWLCPLSVSPSLTRSLDSPQYTNYYNSSCYSMTFSQSSINSTDDCSLVQVWVSAQTQLISIACLREAWQHEKRDIFHSTWHCVPSYQNCYSTPQPIRLIRSED